MVWFLSHHFFIVNKQTNIGSCPHFEMVDPSTQPAPTWPAPLAVPCVLAHFRESQHSQSLDQLRGAQAPATTRAGKRTCEEARDVPQLWAALNRQHLPHTVFQLLMPAPHPPHSSAPIGCWTKRPHLCAKNAGTITFQSCRNRTLNLPRLTFWCAPGQPPAAPPPGTPCQQSPHWTGAHAPHRTRYRAPANRVP